MPFRKAPMTIILMIIIIRIIIIIISIIIIIITITIIIIIIIIDIIMRLITIKICNKAKQAEGRRQGRELLARVPVSVGAWVEFSIEARQFGRFTCRLIPYPFFRIPTILYNRS